MPLKVTGNVSKQTTEQKAAFDAAKKADKLNEMHPDSLKKPLTVDPKARSERGAEGSPNSVITGTSGSFSPQNTPKVTNNNTQGQGRQ